MISVELVMGPRVACAQGPVLIHETLYVAAVPLNTIEK